MDHEELLESAKQAVNAVFGDRSVSRATTKESLRDLISDIETMLETMDFDAE